MNYFLPAMRSTNICTMLCMYKCIELYKYNVRIQASKSKRAYMVLLMDCHDKAASTKCVVMFIQQTRDDDNK